MSQITYLTQEGFDRLKAELEEMKTTGRKEVATAIAEAREKGDLSENAEYDAAKDAQGMLEMRINELEKTLANVRIIDASQVDTSKVVLLSNVTIENLKTGKEMTYQLVSESEADLKERRISANSPIGKGLLGKAVGEIAQVETPSGLVEFRIKDISAVS
ncbi:MAG: transcription elongation factor GreA [Saprospiraceae bacterium]|nr:transcription elongation factor GreA [Saprospiraceae bacterium]